MENDNKKAKKKKYEEGIDFSSVNTLVNVDKLKNKKLDFIITRATSGAYYVDSMFAKHYYDYSLLAKHWGIYHVVRGDISISDQFAIIDLVHEAAWDIDFFALDVELYNKNLLVTATKLGLLMYQMFKKPIFVYTSFGVMSRFSTKEIPSDLYAFPLWVAHWTNESEPMLPKGWNTWYIWQWSSRYNRQGNKYGFKSRDIDLNRWNMEHGSITDFINQFKVS